MATGTPSKFSAPAFHSDDAEQTTEYRTVSALALISLVFGLASPLAFGMPLLIVIPLFGIGVAILAWRRIAVSGGALTGSWAAMIGLILCVASAAAPISRDVALRLIRMREAKDFGRQWLELITLGRPEQAFHLTVEGNRPTPPPEPGAPPPKTTPYQAFLDSPMIKALTKVGSQVEIDFKGTREYTPQTYRNIIVRQRFIVEPGTTADSSGSALQAIEILLTIQRSQFPGESMSRWLISRFEDAKAPADSAPSK